VALQVHTGDWHTASGIYRAWFDQHFRMARPRTWLRQENAWQSTILSNGEDAIIHRFDELPALAATQKNTGLLHSRLTAGISAELIADIRNTGRPSTWHCGGVP